MKNVAHLFFFVDENFVSVFFLHTTYLKNFKILNAYVKINNSQVSSSEKCLIKKMLNEFFHFFFMTEDEGIYTYMIRGLNFIEGKKIYFFFFFI